MKDFGLMENNMEKEDIFFRMAKVNQVIGKMEKELNGQK